MICPHCQANLGKVNGGGYPVLRNRGVVMKADGVCLICPKCSKDVPVNGDIAKALSARILLVFRKPTP